MKKNLLLAAFLMGSFVTVKAQDVILSESFEDTEAVYESGWGGLDLDGDGAAASVYLENPTITAAGFSGQVAGTGNFSVAGGQVVPNADSDNAWWSPEFELPADAPAAVTFKVAGLPLQEGATASYGIYVIPSEDVAEIDNIGDFITYLDGISPVMTEVAPEEATETTVDLSSYAGQTVSVLYRHYQNDEAPAYLFLDDVEVTSGETASVKDLASSKLSVYPNPATNVINVNGANALVNNVAIVDINGRTVKSVKFAGVAEAQVNVSDLASGVYVMTIASDKGTTTQKIVKN